VSGTIGFCSRSSTNAAGALCKATCPSASSARTSCQSRCRCRSACTGYEWRRGSCEGPSPWRYLIRVLDKHSPTTIAPNAARISAHRASPKCPGHYELVAFRPLTNVPIRRRRCCFSGPLPDPIRKAPSSISATCPPEGRFGSCLTNTRSVSESTASNHRSPLAL
jgi:hypothetical protein